MIAIPAIDIYENKVVRLEKGAFDQVTYYKNSPLDQAKLYKSLGFNHIHIVDLLGSKTGKFTVFEVVKQIKEETGLTIQFGGGIRDTKKITDIFKAGIDLAVIGSISVKNKGEFQLIVEKCSPEKIIISADVEDEKILVQGWTEKTSITLSEHIQYCTSLGIDKFLCTDISKDGMLSGTNTNLYKKVMAEFPDIKLIASGGVKDLDDIKVLNEMNIYAVVVGKAIYENKIDLKELSEFAV
ncbi:MAG: 1-(5-phosphoribosyl)-5-[(5-phosphoribosylamino)methylideneamino]imidazole-4-carboxamide isomerase [Ignavibacteriaceae bacterium]